MNKKLKIKKLVSKSIFTSSILIIVSMIYFFMFNKTYTYTYNYDYEKVIKKEEKFYENYDNLFHLNFKYSPKQRLHVSLHKFYDSYNIESFIKNDLKINNSNNYKKIKQIIKRTNIQGIFYLNPKFYGPVFMKVDGGKEFDKNILPKYINFSLISKKANSIEVYSWTKKGRQFQENLERDFFNAIIIFDKLNQNKSNLYNNYLEKLKELKNPKDYFLNNYTSLIKEIDFLYNETFKEMYKLKGSFYSKAYSDINKLKLNLEKNKKIHDMLNKINNNLEKFYKNYFDAENILSLNSVKFNYKLFFSLIVYSIIFSFFSQFVIFEIRNYLNK